MKKFVACLLSVCLSILISNVGTKAVEVSAKSAILINGHTGTVLYSHNANDKLPMASTTKIMTALLLAEQNTPEKTVNVTKEMVSVEGSSMGLLEGDTVSYHALLCGLLLSSGNDAANTVAISIASSVEKFAAIMNSTAKEIGMKNTNFVTPSGLDAEEHYSTAYDMALLARYALKNKLIREIVSMESITVEYGNPPYKRRLTNHNKLLGLYDGCIGVKTGFTKKSGRCLVSAAERDGEYLIAVTLDAPDDWNDHKKLFDYGFSLLTAYDLSSLCSVPQIYCVGSKQLEISVECEEALVGLTKDEFDKITTQFSVEPFVYAPVIKGQTVGQFYCYWDGELILKKDIVSAVGTEYIEPERLSLLENIIKNYANIISYCK